MSGEEERDKKIREGADLRKRTWDVILRKIAGYYIAQLLFLYLCFLVLADFMLYLHFAFAAEILAILAEISGPRILLSLFSH